MKNHNHIKKNNLRFAISFKQAVLMAFCFFIIASAGCKPGGGGGVGSPVVSVTGGVIPHAQELIIDEKSIQVDRITDKSCRIYWKTNVPATSCVEYGLSANYDKTTVEDKNMVLEHYVELYSLIPHTRYYFKVISSDGFNHLAQSIKEIYFDTYDQNFPPAAVTLNAPSNITTNSMSVSWTQSYENDFWRYELYRDTTDAISFMSPKIATITSKMQTAFDDSNLNSNTVYYYLLFAVDTAELSMPSNIVCGTTSVQYNTLTKINLKEPVSKTTDSMVLTWDRCGESDFASYRIYRSDRPGVDTLSVLEAEITDADSTAIEIKNLNENTAYYFKLYLKNKGTVFTASDEASFRTYKNGDLARSIGGVYYGNDIKISNNKAYVSAYDCLYIIDLATYAVRSIDIYGQNDRIRFAEGAGSGSSRFYMVNRSFKEIIVFNTTTDSIEKRMPAGITPVDVAVDEGAGVYYTVDFHEGKVNKYDLSTGGGLSSKYIGPMLTSIIKGVNNSDIFIARQSTSVTDEVLLMPSTLAEIKARAFTGEQPVYLYMDRGGQTVYCANYKSRSVTRINALTGAVLDSFETGTEPHSIVQTPSGNYTFIANFGSSNITMFTNANNSVSETFADGKMPRALEISPNGRELFVVDYENHSVNIYAIKK